MVQASANPKLKRSSKLESCHPGPAEVPQFQRQRVPSAGINSLDDQNLIDDQT
jgi:hypothetical protein